MHFNGKEITSLITTQMEDGSVDYKTEEGEWVGTFRGSVGPYGESTGIFSARCYGAHLNHYGITHVNGIPVHPCE